MSARYQLSRIPSRSVQVPSHQAVIPLERDVTRFGRNPEQVTVVLNSTNYNNMISREHAEIRRQKSPDGSVSFFVQDLSLNGTYVNDIRIVGQTLLHPNDIITFGHVNGAAIQQGERAPPQPDAEFQYRFERISARAPPPAAPPPMPSAYVSQPTSVIQQPRPSGPAPLAPSAAYSANFVGQLMNMNPQYQAAYLAQLQQRAQFARQQMQFLQHPWQAMYPAQQAAAAAVQYPAYFGQMTAAAPPSATIHHTQPSSGHTVSHPVPVPVPNVAPVIASVPSLAPSLAPAVVQPRAAPKNAGAPPPAVAPPAQEPVPALKAECDSSVPSPPASRKSEMDVETQALNSELRSLAQQCLKEDSQQEDFELPDATNSASAGPGGYVEQNEPPPKKKSALIVSPIRTSPSPPEMSGGLGGGAGPSTAIRRSESESLRNSPESSRNALECSRNSLEYSRNSLENLKKPRKSNELSKLLNDLERSNVFIEWDDHEKKKKEAAAKRRKNQKDTFDISSDEFSDSSSENSAESSEFEEKKKKKEKKIPTPKKGKSPSPSKKVRKVSAPKGKAPPAAPTSIKAAATSVKAPSPLKKAAPTSKNSPTSTKAPSPSKKTAPTTKKAPAPDKKEKVSKISKIEETKKGRKTRSQSKEPAPKVAPSLDDQESYDVNRYHLPEQSCAAKKKCRKPQGEQIDWIQCDMCGEWFHVPCTDVDPNSLDDDDSEYQCVECKKI